MSRARARTTAKEPSGAMSGRAAAAAAIEAALTGRRFAMDVLRGMRAEGRLASREAALATEIAIGTIRHVRTIRHLLGVVGTFNTVATPRDVQAILLAAAYQAVWMDRVPMFAAVNEAVELAAAGTQPRAAAMVNALLRRLSAAIAQRRTTWDGADRRQVRVGWDAACGFDREVFPAGVAGPGLLALQTGETVERIKDLTRRFGPGVAAEVAWASQARPPIVLRRQRLRVTGEAFRQAVRAAVGDAAKCDDDTAFIAPDSLRGEIPLLNEGLAFVQDTTAAAAAGCVVARPGERVLDLCAAPGGKSIALALDMEDRGEIVACDVDGERLVRVVENAARLRLSCVRPTLVAGDADLPAVLSEFDAVLVDAPCSNTGVIARRPEARLRFKPRDVAGLAKLQGELVRRAVGCVRQGGRLVYSTCSIEPEENEHVVAEFLRGRDGWTLAASQTTTPRWGARAAEWRDGGFVARMERGD